MQIGSLVFCDTCGNLLDTPDGSHSSKSKISYACNCCGTIPSESVLESAANTVIISNSSDSAFPSVIRSQRSVIKQVSNSDQSNENISSGATIKEKCPKCDNDEMTYQTLQLRSADEGATVFYTCTACGYRYRTNN